MKKLLLALFFVLTSVTLIISCDNSTSNKSGLDNYDIPSKYIGAWTDASGENTVVVSSNDILVNDVSLRNTYIDTYNKLIEKTKEEETYSSDSSSVSYPEANGMKGIAASYIIYQKNADDIMFNWELYISKDGRTLNVTYYTFNSDLVPDGHTLEGLTK